MSEFITRAVDFTPLPEEERAGNQGDGRTLEGYAAVFDAPTEINSWEGHFTEQISRGAFRKTLKERTPVLQFDHGHDSRFGNLPIGSFENIKEDRHGLRVQARLFDHAEPIREAIAAGAVSGMSFRFKVVRDQWHDSKGNEIKDRGELLDKLYNAKKGDKPLARTIKEVKLMEAGPVVFPAYPQTTVGVRSMNDDERRRRLEDIVREGEERHEGGCEGRAEASDDCNMPHLHGEVSEPDVDAAREGLISAGYSADEVIEILEGLRAKASPPSGDSKGKPCSCDMVKGDHYTGDHPKPGDKKKTSSSGGSSAGSEKKSDDVTSEAPEAGSDADGERDDDENPDAAQAGTSGLTKNARERALFLLNLERNES